MGVSDIVGRTRGLQIGCAIDNRGGGGIGNVVQYYGDMRYGRMLDTVT